MKDFLPLFLSHRHIQDPIQFILIPVLAYYLKPIKDGYPNLVIPIYIYDKLANTYYTFDAVITKDITFITLVILSIINLKIVILYAEIRKYSTI